MIDSIFLETMPLYKSIKYEGVSREEDLGKLDESKMVIFLIEQQLTPAITMNCAHCKTRQTFRCDTAEGGRISSSFYEFSEYEVYPKNKANQKLEGTFSVYYRCASCLKHQICFLLKFGNGKVCKVGQSPSPFEFIDIPNSLNKALGTELDLYRKGLMNESVGIGIGAFAYYRRIVENRITWLLDDIALVADKEYQYALRTLKSSHNAADKIRVVVDLLPDRLKNNGVNPLAKIYNGLSIGIHSLTDEECLECAAALRTVFVCLVEDLHYLRNRDKNYAAALKKLDRGT